jgi:hypothetical protein
VTLPKPAKRLLQVFAVFAVFAVFVVSPAEAIAQAAPQPQTTVRDGAHDFDFSVGTWRNHVRQVRNPFTGGDQVSELNGLVTTRKVWNGRAFIEEIEADGPEGHWEGMSLFTYNPQAHQWYQTYADGDDGALTAPTIGAFKDGRGEFYGQEIYKGRSVLVRGLWSNIQADSHTYRIDLSDDGGVNWHMVFVADLTRVKP